MLLVLLAGCRFGGPTGDPTALVEIDAGDDEVRLDASDDGFGEPSPGAPDLTGDGSAGDGDDDDDGGTDGDSGTVDGGAVDGGQCSPAPVAGCDPVSGMGCTEGINQCVVDRGAPSPAGRCIFSSPQLGATCSEDELSSTCPFLFTCIRGACRKYCYCDDDCDLGDTCGESNEQGAQAIFKLCVGTRP